MANTIIKIAVTGGPCAGKTSSMRWLKEYLEKKDILHLSFKSPQPNFYLAELLIQFVMVLYLFKAMY